jgi:TP901 family phage tail tape measure protein
LSDFIAQIQAVLDTSKVEAQLKNLQKNQKIKLDVKLSGDGTDLGKLLEKQMSGLNTTAMKTGQNIGKNFNQGIKSVKFNYDDYFQKYKDAVKDAKKLEKDYNVPNKIAFSGAKANQNAIEKEKQALNKIYDEQQKKIAEFSRKFELGDYKAQRNSIQNKLEKYSNLNNQELQQYADEYEKIYSKISKHFNKTSELSDNNLISEFNKLSEAAKKFNNEIKLIGKPFSILDATTSSNKTLTWLNNNTKAAKEFGEALTELANKQKSATSSEELADYNKQFKAIVSTAQEKGAVGNSFWTEMKRGFSQIGQFVGVYGVLQNGVDITKQMAQAVIDIDTAMTNLYKVTDETSNKYNKFLSNAGKTAKDVGRDISSYITQTSEWAKLGYSMDSSANLAKISSIYSNVGEVDDKTAVSDLVTVMKAYDIQYDDALSIVDKYNKLGNEFATSAKDLGEGMSHAASMMSLGGTDLNKALAMLTGGAEITQSAGELGNALKIGQMRIQGMKGDLEALGEESEGLESVSKIQTHILNLTKGQVNIMDSADPTKFRDYYDILEDVSKVWNQLDQTKRADLLETMFGKNRGNQGAAVIQAFQSGQVQKAYAATLNAEGSAMQEQERWLESIEAKIQQFKASFQNLSNTTLSSDLFKGVIDSGTAFLDILTNILDVGNGIPASLGTIGAVSFFKNLDLFYY